MRLRAWPASVLPEIALTEVEIGADAVAGPAGAVVVAAEAAAADVVRVAAAAVATADRGTRKAAKGFHRFTRIV